MITRIDVTKGVVFAVLALVLGFFGLSLLFSDLGPGESWTDRLAITAAFYVASGLVIGYLNPKLWMIAGLTAWGAVLLGIVGLINVLVAGQARAGSPRGEDQTHPGGARARRAIDGSEGRR
jgi:hypothetical protein